MKPLNAGDLRHRITVQNAVDSTNAYGERVPVWEDFAATWANIEPLSGRQIITEKSQSPVETHRITLRYMAGVLVTMRIVHRPAGGGEQIFSINAIGDEENRHYKLVISATEVRHP